MLKSPSSANLFKLKSTFLLFISFIVVGYKGLTNTFSSNVTQRPNVMIRFSFEFVDGETGSLAKSVLASIKNILNTDLNEEQHGSPP